MATAAIVVLVVMLFTGFVTLMAISWAASERQFGNFDDASRVIREPNAREGEPTDQLLQAKKNSPKS